MATGLEQESLTQAKLSLLDGENQRHSLVGVLPLALC